MRSATRRLESLRRSRRAAPLIALLAVTLSIALLSCDRVSERSAATPSSRGGPIYLMPLGEPGPAFLDELARHYADKFGLRVVVLAPIPIEETALDRYRGQVILEELLTLMRRRHPVEAADPTGVMVGITVYDGYIRGYPQWGWAFSLREDNRFAMVSTARMDERNFGASATTSCSRRACARWSRKISASCTRGSSRA